MRKNGPLAGCLMAALCAAVPGYARADTLSLMSQFNVISFGNFSTGSDVEGRALVGGNVTGLNTMANNAARPPYGTSAYGELTVYGGVTDGTAHSINLPGGVTILGNNSATFNINSGNIAVGGNNSGQLTTGGGSVAVLGSNTNLLSSKGGNAVYVGNGNSGEIDTYGSGNSIGINGNNSNTLKVNDGGSAQIRGNNYGSVNLSGGNLTVSGSTNPANGSGHTYANTPVSVTAPTVSLPSFNDTFKTPLTQLSTQLAALAPTAATPALSSAVSLSAPVGASGVAVLNVTSALFSSNTNINISLVAGESLIINVTIPGCVGGGAGCALDIGSSIHIANANGANSAIASYLLWNFEDATSLTIGTAWEGSILAPYASLIDSNQPIDGTVVANSYSGVGELHSYSFLGTVTTPTQPGTPVPEPSSLAVLLSGLVAIGLLRHRRTRG